MNTPMAEARPFEAPNPAAGASAAANPPPPPQILNPPAGLLWLLGIGLLGCLILLSVAVARHELALVSGAIWMLGATTLGVAVLALILLCRALSIQLITALSKDGPPRFERHWGGIGGSVGGWSVSQSFLWLIALIAALAALVAVLNEVKDLSVYLLGGPSSAAHSAEPAPAPAGTSAGARSAARHEEAPAAKPATNPAAPPAAKEP